MLFDNVVIDLNRGDEFKLPVSYANPAFITLVNPKLRKPFRVEIPPNREELPYGFGDNFGQIVVYPLEFGIKQFAWFYDPNGSFESNYDPNLTNFVSIEIRYMWEWTPRTVDEIELYGSEPYTGMIIFVNYEVPVDNFERLSNFNPHPPHPPLP